MAFVLNDRVKETTTTTGSSDITFAGGVCSKFSIFTYATIKPAARKKARNGDNQMIDWSRGR